MIVIEIYISLIRKTRILSFEDLLLLPLKQFIQKLLIRPKLLDMCNHWINHETSINLIDVYDGDIWKEFMNPSDLKTLKTIALMMNVD